MSSPIDSPSIAVTAEEGFFSFSDIIETLAKKLKSEKKEVFPLSINNITIHNGALEFDDQAVTGSGVNRRSEQLQFLGTIPYLANTYITPRISAVVNSTRFAFSGKLKPLSTSMETSVHIDLKQLELPALVAVLAAKTAGSADMGKFVTLNTRSELPYFQQTKNLNSRLTARRRARDITVIMNDGKPLFKLPSLKVAGVPSGVLLQAVRIYKYYFG